MLTHEVNPFCNMAVHKGTYLLSVLLAISTIHQGFTISSGLKQPNNLYFLCPGDTVVYQCIVCGAGATVWSGSLFDCPAGDITLRHREFRGGSITGECNNGAVIAQSIGLIVDVDASGSQCYSSQLNISTNIDMNNKTVECLHVDSKNETVIDTLTLAFNTEIPPPDSVYLSDAGPTHFTLNWNLPTRYCTAEIGYRITGSRNCGTCTNIMTNTTSITCSSLSINGQPCNLTIQADSDPVGINSDPIQVVLKTPDPPESIKIKVKKMLIDIKFQEPDPVNISNEIGNLTQFLAANYTLSFYDFYTNDCCGSISLSASSCVGRTCHTNYSTGEFLPACNRSNIVKVIIHATNAFGNGSQSDPIQISIAAPNVIVTTTHSNVLIITSSVVVGVVLIAIIVIVILCTTYIKFHNHLIVRTKNTIESHDLSTDYSTCPEEKGTKTVIYADVGPLTKTTTQNIQNYFLDDDVIEYVQVSQESATIGTVKEETQYQDADKSLNLDTLLIQISSHINSRWYQFGLAIGVPKEILENCLSYPSEQCVIEVLDYWLRVQKECKPTWKTVAEGLQAIGHNSLANGILNVYKTGKLPVEVDMDAVPNRLSPPQDINLDNDEEIPPPIPPKTV